MVESRAIDPATAVKLQSGLVDLLRSVPGPLDAQVLEPGREHVLLGRLQLYEGVGVVPPTLFSLMRYYVSNERGMVPESVAAPIVPRITNLYHLPDVLGQRNDGGLFGKNAAQAMIDVLNLCYSSEFRDPVIEAGLIRETREYYGVDVVLGDMGEFRLV